MSKGLAPPTSDPLRAGMHAKLHEASESVQNVKQHSRARMICSSCKEPHNREGQRHCKSCHAIYMVQWRKVKSQRVKQQTPSADVSHETMA